MGQGSDILIVMFSLVAHDIKNNYFLTFIVFLREKDRARAGEGQRDGETQHPKQAPGSKLSTQILTQGSNP